jgi:IS30 family transposase
MHQSLWSGGRKYRKQGTNKDKRGQVTGRVGIAKRPAGVAEKARAGDLEMDLVIGRGHQGALLTVNDRATGVLKMKKLGGKGVGRARDAALELLAGLSHLHTITPDNGKDGGQSLPTTPTSLPGWALTIISPLPTIPGSGGEQ